MRALAKSEEVETRFGTIDEARRRYSLGANTVRNLAQQAGAIVKIGRSVRVNFRILDEYLDALSGEE